VHARLLVAAAAAWLLLADGAAAQLVAERITAPRFDALRVGGPDADAGVGDWALGNGTLCAAVSDPSHESHLHAQGGVLIDLGHCGKANDQWSILQPLTNLNRTRMLPGEEVRAERGESEARIVVSGEMDGVRAETAYVVGLVDPSRLRVSTRLERTGEGEAVFAVGFVTLHSGAQLRPFALDTRRPERSAGFSHPKAEPERIWSMLRAIRAADLHVLVGGDAVQPPLAYGIKLDSAVRIDEGGERSELPFLSITGFDFTIVGAFPRRFWLGSGDPPGVLELAQSLFMDLEPGEVLELAYSIRLGDRADVASITDALWADAPLVTGRVDEPAARLHVERQDGSPVTELRSDSQGRFEFRVPAGRYRLAARAPGGLQTSREFRVAEGDTELEPIQLGSRARVLLPRGPTMRLVFVGVDGTDDPDFGNDQLGFRLAEEPVLGSLNGNVVSLAGVEADPAAVVVAPGRYRVYATRGLEYGVTESLLEVEPGEFAKLEIGTPAREIETPGWIAADLHVHSGESFDSSLPLVDQVRAFVAQGIEVMVATEHDRVFDPAPAIRRLGLAQQMVGVTGVEITGSYPGGRTPHTVGHTNAFPVPYLRSAYRGGAPLAEGRRLRGIYQDLRALPAEPLVQLNHPRGNAGDQSELYYFTHLGTAGAPYDPTLPLTAEPNAVLLEVDPSSGLRDIDFDAIEVLNGPSLVRYRNTRADWLSLLLQGVRATGTANSDSHHVWEVPGVPRTYVQLPEDTIAAFEPARFVASLRAGRAFGTTGPLLQVKLGEAGPGETFSGARGRLSVAIEAARWVPVDSMRVFVGGDVFASPLVQPGFTSGVDLRFEQDTFVIVEISGVPDERYAALLPDFVPLAFSNPIYVDADGDGEWTPPGLPERLPEALTDPLGL